jgi:RNA polymerase sigma factor (sigma-70 family)
MNDPRGQHVAPAWFRMLESLEGGPVERGAAFLELRRLARRCLGRRWQILEANGVDPEGLVNDAIAHFLRQKRRGAIRNEAAFPGFAQAHLIRECGRALRKVRVPEIELDEAHERPGPDAAVAHPDSAAAASEASRLVREALAEIDPQARRILELTVMGDAPLADAAAQLGLTYGQYRYQESLALESLADRLRARGLGSDWFLR